MADDNDQDESVVTKYAKKMWKGFKDGFKPMEARSYNDDSSNQYAEDQKLSPEERVAKFRKGFLGDK